jgi:hypothetical protein
MTESSNETNVGPVANEPVIKTVSRTVDDTSSQVLSDLPRMLDAIVNTIGLRIKNDYENAYHFTAVDQQDILFAAIDSNDTTPSLICGEYRTTLCYNGKLILTKFADCFHRFRVALTPNEHIKSATLYMIGRCSVSNYSTNEFFTVKRLTETDIVGGSFQFYDYPVPIMLHELGRFAVHIEIEPNRMTQAHFNRAIDCEWYFYRNPDDRVLGLERSDIGPEWIQWNDAVYGSKPAIEPFPVPRWTRHKIPPLKLDNGKYVLDTSDPAAIAFNEPPPATTIPGYYGADPRYQYVRFLNSNMEKICCHICKEEQLLPTTFVQCEFNCQTYLCVKHEIEWYFPCDNETGQCSQRKLKHNPICGTNQLYRYHDNGTTEYKPTITEIIDRGNPYVNLA